MKKIILILIFIFSNSVSMADYSLQDIHKMISNCPSNTPLTPSLQLKNTMETAAMNDLNLAREAISSSEMIENSHKKIHRSLQAGSYDIFKLCKTGQTLNKMSFHIIAQISGKNCELEVDIIENIRVKGLTRKKYSVNVFNSNPKNCYKSNAEQKRVQ